MAMKPGAVRKPKACKACSDVFQPTGNAAKFCTPCAEFRTAWMVRKHSMTRHEKAGRKVGTGSGGHNETGCHDQKYRQWFLMDVWRKQDGRCGDCDIELSPDLMLLHHIDHDRTNNELYNFAGVCKRCHQLEHECWMNLPQFRKV